MFRAPGTIVCATFALPARPPPFSSPVMSHRDMRNYVPIVSRPAPEAAKAARREAVDRLDESEYNETTARRPRQ